MQNSTSWRESESLPWVDKACAAANIPLNKSENPTMREFLLSLVVNGGTIPKGTQLRDNLLDGYYMFTLDLQA